MRHACDGESCTGCGRCYRETGETVCDRACKHAETNDEDDDMMTMQEAAEACGVRVTNLGDPLRETAYCSDARAALATAQRNGWTRVRIEPDFGGQIARGLRQDRGDA